MLNLSDPEIEDGTDQDIPVETSSLQSNLITIFGTLGVLGSFFGLGALLFTAFEVHIMICNLQYIHHKHSFSSGLDIF